MTTDLSAAMRRDSQAQLSVTDYLRSLRRALEWAMFAPDGPAPQAYGNPDARSVAVDIATAPPSALEEFDA